MFNLGNLSQIDFVSLRDGLMQRFDQALNCLRWQTSDMRRVRAALESEYGVIPQDTNDVTYQARSAAKLPLIFQPEDRVGVVVRTPLDLIGQNGGRAPNRGFIANIGTDEFDIMLHGTEGAVGPITLPPSATLAITFYLTGVDVIPVDAAPARYQVVAQ